MLFSFFSPLSLCVCFSLLCHWTYPFFMKISFFFLRCRWLGLLWSNRKFSHSSFALIFTTDDHQSNPMTTTTTVGRFSVYSSQERNERHLHNLLNLAFANYAFVAFLVCIRGLVTTFSYQHYTLICKASTSLSWISFQHQNYIQTENDTFLSAESLQNRIGEILPQILVKALPTLIPVTKNHRRGQTAFP